MTELDLMFRRLDIAARRIRVNERLEDGTRLLICLLALLVAWQVLDGLVDATPVMQALAPLFIAGLVAVVLWFAWRLFGRDWFVPPDRAGAAALIDARAGLNNELSSALWFSGDARPDEFVNLHLARADNAASALVLDRLLPVVSPRSAPVALMLGAVAAVLAFVSLVPDAGSPDSAPIAMQPGQSGSESIAALEPAEGDAAIEEEFSGQIAETAWLKVEQLARELRAGPHSAQVAEAIAARDAKKASRLLASMRTREAAQPATGKAARPETEQMSEQLAKGIVDRLQSLLNEAGGWSDQVAAADDASYNERLTDDLTRELREEMRDAQESLPGEMSEEENVLNTTLQGMSRDSTGGQEMVRGEVNPMQGLGRTSVGSGAMGRRVGVSTGGAGDGEQPTGNPEGDAEAEPVLGRKTMRLQLQMQTVKIDQPDTEQSDGSEESFYAATQAQAANTQYEDVMARQQGSAEQTGSAARLPIAYRDAVRAYAARQHRRDVPSDQ